jgi:hypothetical protein
LRSRRESASRGNLGGALLERSELLLHELDTLGFLLLVKVFALVTRLLVRCLLLRGFRVLDRANGDGGTGADVAVEGDESTLIKLVNVELDFLVRGLDSEQTGYVSHGESREKKGRRSLRLEDRVDHDE